MKFFFCSLFFFTSIFLFSQQKKALVVGIEDYPVTSGWSKINANNDITLLKKEIERNGFSLSVIENQKATRKGIVDALQKLLKDTRVTDTIVIHFSCHGQQVLSKEGKLQEALIPYDAKKFYTKNIYQGENHLLDHELGEFFNRIRKKIGVKGVLFVTIDACHSGDAVRAMEDDAPIRGTSAVFTDDPFYSTPNIKTVEKNKVIPSHNQMSPFCAVYACQSYQNNYELKVGDRFYGSLSYAFNEALKKSRTFEPAILAKEVVNEMNKRVKKQNPYFESTFIF